MSSKKTRAKASPSKLTPALAAKIYVLARRGFTDQQIADLLAIHRVSIWRWRVHPDFFSTLQANKKIADAIVARSLYERATGYSLVTEELANGVPVTITKSLPPDVVACIFWLKNRAPAQWRDQHELAHRGSIGMTFVDGLKAVVEGDRRLDHAAPPVNGHDALHA